MDEKPRLDVESGPSYFSGLDAILARGLAAGPDQVELSYPVRQHFAILGATIQP